MRVTKDFVPYNHRRYGKPWIARVVSWPIGKAPELDFGSVIGLTAEIDALAGDIVRWGQRDHRGNNSYSAWGTVLSDASIVEIFAEQARLLWLDSHEDR